MKRRNFFATLLAPIAARFLPKPATKVMPNGSEFKFVAKEWVQVIEVWPKPPFKHYFVSYNGIWKFQPNIGERPPFVRIVVPQYPWQDMVDNLYPKDVKYHQLSPEGVKESDFS